MSSIWFNNIEILFSKDNFTQIVPTKEMTFEEKINSITRFSLYLSILLYLVTGNYLYIYIFVITVIVFYLVYVFGGKEMFEGFMQSNSQNNISESVSEPVSVPSQSTSTTETTTVPKIPCKEPTNNNPLMNLMTTDNYHKSLPACINSEEDIKSKIDDNFKQNLYLDTNTIYNNRTNQRSFYTMPNTQPANDQTAFAKWLYHIPISCEESKSGKLTLHKGCSYTQKSLGELEKEL